MAENAATGGNQRQRGANCLRRATRGGGREAARWAALLLPLPPQRTVGTKAAATLGGGSTQLYDRTRRIRLYRDDRLVGMGGGRAAFLRQRAATPCASLLTLRPAILRSGRSSYS